MKVLITGGAGFIGSHLSEHLLAKGHSVCIIDDLSTGKHENIAHLENCANFQMVIDSVRNRTIMEELIKSCDVVFHLASAVGVNLIIQQPIRTIETIVEGTSVVLSGARRYRKRVLITSTSEVYGKGSKIPFSENDDTVQGATTRRRWAYANAKALDEFLAFAHWYETKLPVICVRLFNTVGPRQTGQYGMVIPRFVKQALTGEPITVYGDGEQSRSFCHVKDIVEGFEKIIDCPESFGKVINFGNPEEITMNQLALRIKQLTNSSSEIIHIPYEKAYGEGFEDMRRRVPNIALAKQLIGFEPRYSLDDILNSIISHFKKDYC
jgi:UDP-glucose 4-epimerase